MSIFNSLLPQLVKYDVHTTRKINSIHAIFYHILSLYSVSRTVCVEPSSDYTATSELYLKSDFVLARLLIEEDPRCISKELFNVLTDNFHVVGVFYKSN